MTSPQSVTVWLTKLKAGDPAAAQKVWEHYFARLVGLARAKLHGAPRRSADEEDVALSAFDSFCRGVERGAFPQLADSNDLWQLLLVITERKAYDLLAREQAQKRGGHRLRDEAALAGAGMHGPGGGLDDFPGREPTPDFAAQAAEELERLLGLLKDGVLRSVAIWRMEGYKQAEIAERLDCDERTVQRKMDLIRAIWKRELPMDDSARGSAGG